MKSFGIVFAFLAVGLSVGDFQVVPQTYNPYYARSQHLSYYPPNHIHSSPPVRPPSRPFPPPNQNGYNQYYFHSKPSREYFYYEDTHPKDTVSSSLNFRSEETENNDEVSYGVGRIAIYPNGHLCSCYFVTKDIAVTAASCIYDFKNDVSRLFVEIPKSGTANGTDPSVNFSYEPRNISTIEVFEKYNPETGRNNIGVIKLDKPVDFDMSIFAMPVINLRLNLDSLPGYFYIYRWIFSSDYKKYYLVREKVVFVSDNNCQPATTSGVYLCFGKENESATYSLGQFDIGAPVQKDSKERVVYGFYTGGNRYVESNAQLYLGALHFAAFVNDFIKKNE